MTMRLWRAIVVVGLLTPGGPQAPDLTGRWVLVGEVGPGLEAVVPAQQPLTMDGATVTVERGTRPPSTERYRLDGTEAEVPRVVGQARTCRALWDGGALVLSCRQPARGPGGQGQPITTREVLRLDTEGDLVVERTWRSGTRETVDRWRFRREDR